LDTNDRLTAIHAKTSSGLLSQLFSTLKHFTPFPAGEEFRFFVQDKKKTENVLVSVQTFSSASYHQQV